MEENRFMEANIDNLAKKRAERKFKSHMVVNFTENSDEDRMMYILNTQSSFLMLHHITYITYKMQKDNVENIFMMKITIT